MMILQAITHVKMELVSNISETVSFPPSGVDRSNVVFVSTEHAATADY
jgi:hypothetical protein